MPPRKKRAAAAPVPQLTAASTREDVEVWLRKKLPTDLAKNLIDGWRAAGELFDGDVLLSADEQLLMDTGCSRTVARKILQLVQAEQREQQPQMAAPAAEEDQAEDGNAVAEDNAKDSKQQQPQRQQQRGRRGGPRRGRSRKASQAPGDEQAEDQDEDQAMQEDEQEGDEAQEAEPMEEQAEGTAVDDHAVPLSAGMATRRSSRRLSRQRQGSEAPAGSASPPRVATRQLRKRAASRGLEEDQSPAEEEAQQVEAAAEPGAQQQGAQQAQRGRQSRISAIHTTVLQRPVLGGPARPAAAAPAGEGRQEQQQQEQPQQALPSELAGPPVVADLGREALPGQYMYEWEGPCYRGLEELFLNFFTLEQLREVVEWLQEEWEESAEFCLKELRRENGVRRWMPHKRPEKVVKKLLKLLQTGSLSDRPNEGGGMNKEGLQELLQLEVCNGPVREYVEQRLKPRLQNVPEAADHHELLWKLWRVPLGPAQPQPSILWGSRRFSCVRIAGQGLEPGNSSEVPWSDVWRALVQGDLRLENQADHMDWLAEVEVLSSNSRLRVGCVLDRRPSQRVLRVSLHQTIDGSGGSVLSAAQRIRSEPDLDDELMYTDAYEAVLGADLALVVGQLDQHHGTAPALAMARMMAGYRDTERHLMAQGLPAVLPADAPLGKGQFEALVKPCIEATERPEPEGFQQLCDSSFLLKLAPHQRRAVAHMLEKERGGLMADLWVKVAPPGHSGLHWYVSPVLRQSRVFFSKAEAEQSVHAHGGVGWVALQVGMGKTACGVAVVQLNPVPAGWRQNRAYQTPRADDHMAAAVNNRPHGGTLIVVPTAIVTQWATEFKKTTSARLTLHKWVDGTKANPLLHDARTLALYDVVLTDMNTLKQAANMNTISAIRWHRVIVDESQQSQCACLLNNRDLMAANRWLLTGTPDNENNLESMAAQYGFLKLGPFGPLHTHMPAALTHMLKSVMVFYSKDGSLEGQRRNLELPPLDERVIECKLSEEDAGWYDTLKQDQRDKYRALMWKAGVNPDAVGDVADPWWRVTKQGLTKHMPKLRQLVVPLRQAASSAFKQLTGAEHYDAGAGRYVKETRQYTSKVEAVLDVLRRKALGEKVVVFSEFQPLLRALKGRLPELGLDSRDLMGSSKAEKRGQAIDDFQTAPPTQVFLCPHRTGGAGVTLTSGSHVILCEPVLNPTFEEQAIGRCNRFGQTVSVKVTRLVMKGTIEEKVVEFMQQRTGGDGDGLTDRSSKLTIDDLDWLVHDTGMEAVDEC